MWRVRLKTKYHFKGSQKPANRSLSQAICFCLGPSSFQTQQPFAVKWILSFEKELISLPNQVMAYSVDKHEKSVHEFKPLGSSLVQVLLHLYTRSVSFRHRGILMPCTELAVLHLYSHSQPCSGLPEATQSSKAHCFAMKNTATTNYGWLLMMEGATAPSSSVGKTMPGW